MNGLILKELTEQFFKERKMKEWKLINNGVLEYGNWLIQKSEDLK